MEALKILTVEEAKRDILLKMKQKQKLNLSVDRFDEFKTYQVAYEGLFEDDLSEDDAYELSKYGFANRLNACID
ncbi:MAG: hypothetical protein NTX25_03565 [Proteobacteria bacterium]|nr:hypothetical protein [Pseudomonadota bacterium]